MLGLLFDLLIIILLIVWILALCGVILVATAPVLHVLLIIAIILAAALHENDCKKGAKDKAHCNAQRLAREKRARDERIAKQKELEASIVRLTKEPQRHQ